ncbi:MAG TPA: hypothetical protein VMI06_20025 [Terriglobia bacterium]|nr:hypothetical protein [Terriglobia bacterium]
MAADQGSLERLKQELEDYIYSASQPVLLDGDGPPLHLAAHEWQLTLQFGKLVLEVWNSEHSFAWRVDELAYRRDGCLGLSVRRPGAHRVNTLELRQSSPRMPAPAEESRSAFRQELVAFLRNAFPEWKLDRVASRSDREHSFSIRYTRGLLRRGRVGWAFLGLGDSGSFAAADDALAYGLNWLDWLRETENSCVVSGLKLFLPQSAVALTAHRAAYLDPKAVQIEIFECGSETGFWSPVDLADFGNVETHLTPRRRSQLWIDRHRNFLHSVFGKAIERTHLATDAAGSGVSIRILGLEIARLEGDVVPRLTWGAEGNRKEYHQGQESEIQKFVSEILDIRRPGSNRAKHDVYRAQPERWLESLLVRDVTLLDPALNAGCVYPQVPAFSGGDRGVVDILTVLRDGRLAVIELKLHEEITLPMQGLDYWLRVKWLNDRCQFQNFGYFDGLQLAQAPPVLYLVSPAFRFHSTSQRIIRYLSRSVEVIQVGINHTWRHGVKILFRRALHP